MKLAKWSKQRLEFRNTWTKLEFCADKWDNEFTYDYIVYSTVGNISQVNNGKNLTFYIRITTFVADMKVTDKILTKINRIDRGDLFGYDALGITSDDVIAASKALSRLVDMLLPRPWEKV